MQQFLTKNQILLLRLFYTNPSKSFYMQEVAGIIGKKAGVFQRTLNVLVEEKLLNDNYRGNNRFFQANTKHVLYPEMKRIIFKAAGGLEASLKDLVNHIPDVKFAMIFGSFARGNERNYSDVDLLVAGSPSAEKKLSKELPRLERQLQREINCKWYTLESYRKQYAKDPFLKAILRDKKIILKGDPDAI